MKNTSVSAHNLCSMLQQHLTHHFVLLISARFPSISASRGGLITCTCAHVFQRVGPRLADLAATIHKDTRSCENLLRVSRLRSTRTARMGSHAQWSCGMYPEHVASAASGAEGCSLALLNVPGYAHQTSPWVAMSGAAPFHLTLQVLAFDTQSGRPTQRSVTSTWCNKIGG